MDAEEWNPAAQGRAYARRWKAAATALDELRLRDLRALTDLESARRFALITAGAEPRLRPTSGLVEQQRVLARLRR